MKRIKVIALLAIVAVSYALYQRVMSTVQAFEQHDVYMQCVHEKIANGVGRAEIDRMQLCGPNPLGGK